MKKLLLGCVLAIAPLLQLPVQAEVPTAQEVGKLMGVEMCNELIDNKTLLGDAAFEEVYQKLSQSHGADAEALFANLGSLFNESGDVIANNPYAFEMFQVLFQHLVTDDRCFHAFLENEVFKQEEAPPVSR